MREKRFTVNDADRREWVENHEGLYRAWKRSGRGLHVWTRTHRPAIDATIEAETGHTIYRPGQPAAR